MARIKNSLCENIRGHWGNMIFYSYLGHTYMRSYPKKVHNPRTPLQQQQRNRMRDVTIFYKIVNQSPLARVWHQAGYVQGMKGPNLFVRLNIAAFSGNGRVTDYDKLHFSYGLLPQSDCFRVVYRNSGTSMDISWENTSLLNKERYMDLFMAVVLFENNEFIAFTNLESVYQRADCHARLHLPEDNSRPCRVYCFFASADGNNYSCDVCCQPEE